MIAQRIYHHARTAPQRRAIVWNGLPVSYAQLAQAIEALRQPWRALSLPPGSVAVVVAHSLLDNWIVVLALQSLGLVTVCARSLPEARNLELRRVSCVVLCGRKAADNRAALADWPQARHLEVPADLFRRAAAPVPPCAHEGFVPGGGHLLCTSGTTGTSRKVLHDNALDLERCERRVAREGLDAQVVVNSLFLGLWTALGYTRALPVWHAGGCMVLDQRPDWPLHLGEHGVTHVSLVSGLLEEALRVHAGAGAPAWQFRLSVGGGFISPGQAREARERLTPHLTINYASTELWLPAMRSTLACEDDLHWWRPWGERVVEVVDEDGQPCANGVEGALRVRLDPHDYHGYVDAPEQTARVFRDGWFHPGDMGVRRADGRIRVLGRTADVLNIRGSKIASAPLEERVRELLGAGAVCAFSGPDPLGQDQVVVAIETVRTLPRERLEAAIRNAPLLDGARLVQLREFPRTQTGTRKVDRLALRRLVFASLFAQHASHAQRHP